MIDSKNRSEIISGQAFLYSFKKTVLTCREGTVFRPYCFGLRRHENLAKFESLKLDENAKILCHKHPGIVYNDTVWFPEKDEKQAVECLIQYYKTKIDELAIKSARYRNQIELLKGGDK